MFDPNLVLNVRFFRKEGVIIAHRNHSKFLIGTVVTTTRLA
jgi:hypothetical protein